MRALSRILFPMSVLVVALPAVALDLPRLSPLARVMQTVGITEVTVEYSSPAVRDRVIFGGLVPYDELWRTGANAATKITFSRDVEVGGEKAPAGTYAIFTIPGEKSWTFILNDNPDQGGTREYDSELDRVRIEVKPEKAPVRERMTFLFTDTTDDSTRLDLTWAGTRVSVPIEVDTAAYADAVIDEAVDSAARDLTAAARYMADDVGDLERASSLIDRALVVQPGWLSYWVKADLLARKGNYEQAYPMAERAWKLGQEADFFFYEDRVKKALEEWKDK